MLGETIVTSEPLVEGLSNPEVVAAFGADLILLNKCDLLCPKIAGVTGGGNPVAAVQRLVGRPVGVNLEAVDPRAAMMESQLMIPDGRRVTEASVRAGNELGVDFICLTGNPATGVTNAAILASVGFVRERFSGLLLAGKMHTSGVAEELLDEQSWLAFLAAGADGILVPAPGTVPGVREENLALKVAAIRAAGGFTVATIGTSQESAEVETVRQIALASKRSGVDVHHIGDGSFSGVAIPENITGLSIAIRGKRHTYFRMAASLGR